MSLETDVFLSHNWGPDSQGRDNHERVGKVSDALEARGYNTWYDSDDMYGSIAERMAEGIDNTNLVLVFVTSNYRDKVNGSNSTDNCKLEFQYAMNTRKPEKCICVVMEREMGNPSTWGGILGLYTGTKLYVSMWEDFSEDYLNKQIDVLCNEMVRYGMSVKGSKPATQNLPENMGQLKIEDPKTPQVSNHCCNNTPQESNDTSQDQPKGDGPGIRGLPQKGDFKYFVRWDMQATGGRFFECRITSGEENDHLFSVRVHDGDTGTYPNTEIFKLGVPAQIGDDVIAYFDGRGYAFKGKATMFIDRKFFVEFDDCNDKAWVDPTKVYKMEHLTIVGKAQKGNFELFVRMDGDSSESRYCECKLMGMHGNELRSFAVVMTHDENEKEYPSTEVFKIGTPAYEGDDVIAYLDDGPYAYKGMVVFQKDGKSFVKFDKGDSTWVETAKVYKMVEFVF